jgi:hypothetical protein
MAHDEVGAGWHAPHACSRDEAEQPWVVHLTHACHSQLPKPNILIGPWPPALKVVLVHRGSSTCISAATGVSSSIENQDDAKTF